MNLTNDIPITSLAVNKTVGDIIYEKLEAKGLKQSELCDLTGIAKPVLNDVIKGRRNLSAEMAVLIESALGLSADMLLSVQIKDELDKAYSNGKIINQLRCMSDWGVMSEHISIPVLKKLGLLQNNVRDKVHAAMALFHVSGIEEFTSIAEQEQTQTYYKKSEKMNIDNKALFTWKYYCIDVASKTAVARQFNENGIENLNTEIKRILTENQDTYNRVKDAFFECGIRLLYINKEGQVPVDGMSFWFGDNPTVVITRRLSNIDNFAFSIMHELGHVKMHLKKESSVLVNLDGAELDKIEMQANEYARNSFVPQKEWERFMESIRNCNPYTVYAPIAKEAAKRNINPQILYGRYMHDTGLYRLRRVFPTEIR